MLVQFKSGRSRRFVSFSRKNLRGALLGGISLAYADFSGAQLTGADFTNSNLTGASFAGADLSDVSFRDCNLFGADFSGSNVDGADIGGATMDDDTLDHFRGRRTLAFDWDDNILFMPTDIILFRKKGGRSARWLQQIPISTDTFAKIRNVVGKSSRKGFYVRVGGEAEEALSDTEGAVEIDYENYSIEPESFERFRDSRDVNYMLEDMEQALLGEMFAPSWSDFVRACSTKDGAGGTYIITARGHSRKTMRDALIRMRELGYIKHVPPRRNLFPVGEASVRGDLSPEEAKTEIVLRLLDVLDSNPSPMNTFGFSDDDRVTYNTVKKRIKAEVTSGRWSSHIDISLFFTGGSPRRRGKRPLEISTTEA